MGKSFLPYNSKLKQLARNLRKRSTLSEVPLWKQLKGKQMLGYDFHRQKPIDNFIVDFYCPRLRLVVEIDGISHDLKDREDQDRQKTLESLGLQFLRFGDEEVRSNVDGVVWAIQEWIMNETRRQRTHTAKSPLANHVPSRERGLLQRLIRIP